MMFKSQNLAFFVFGQDGAEKDCIPLHFNGSLGLYN